MDNLDDQIQQFWENRLSPEQRREVLRQLDQSGMEWKDFMQQYYHNVLAGEEAGTLKEEQKSRVWQRLQEQHLRNENTAGKLIGIRSARAWLPWMAAACVLVIAGLFLYRKDSQPVQPIPIVRQQPVAAKMIDRKNTGAGEETVLLPDSSTAILAPGSSIHYRERFEAHARNIQLEGRALFEVTKDAAKPFTVTAHGFATTALGTRFIVDATRPVVSIRLLRGKIVVNATTKADMALQKVYLTPGQELKINTLTKHFDKIIPNSKPDHNDIATKETIAALSFERTSLAIVFKRLSDYYKTPILYNKAEVQGLSFTGDFKPSDQLELALKVICTMNSLSFAKKNDRILINKK